MSRGLKASGKVMALTPSHVARVHRIVADTGPPAGILQQTDADYADWVQRIAVARPDPGRPSSFLPTAR